MLRLGDIDIEMPAVQAALSGYSDGAMRRIAREHGARFCFHEVVLDETVLGKGRLREAALRVAADDHPVGGQLMGARPETFAAAANVMVEAGYDVIDINFGCPVNKVLGRCRGGYHLSQPAVALEIVGRVIDAVDARVPVTVKMRRGIDDSAAAERDFFVILDGALALGIAAVTVHGRTVAQKYNGPSRWTFLKKVKRHIGDCVMLGSGDLFGVDDVLAMLRETGVDGVTLARGCIGNPWLFAQTEAALHGRSVPAPSLAEQGATILRHWRYARELHGDRLALRKMRTHAIHYAHRHPGGVAVRDAFVAVRDTGGLTAAVDRWYGGLVAESSSPG